MSNKSYKSNKRKKIAVAMSGGVDSSVSAALLKEQGYDVVGVFMKVWAEPTDNRQPITGNCPWVEDQFEARRAAEHLGIPFYTINLEKEYKKAVVDYFFREYEAGRTPNPDVMCNSEIKFGIFLTRMLEMGADYIATGHYARISQKSKVKSQKFNNEISLLRGKDPKKDQTYFLWRFTQDQLRKVIFPVGGYRKSQVRELAKKFGLPNANRKDSQGICFIGPVDMAEFLKTRLPVRIGKVVTTDGEKVGEHRGAWFYTIGQRHGWVPNAQYSLGSSRSEPILAASSVAAGSARSVNLSAQGGTMPNWPPRASSLRHRLALNRPPLYVVGKDLKNHILTVGPADDPQLWARGMTVSQLNWLTSLKFKIQNSKFECQVQIRYQQKPIGCTVRSTAADQLEVIFDESVRAVTPGQSAVFYDTERVLGGGVIEKAIG